MHVSISLLLAGVSTAAAASCPMAELSRRGLAPPDIEAIYLSGRGLGEPVQKRQENGPSLAEPISEVLSPLELGALTPRSPRSKQRRQENGPSLAEPVSEVLSPLELGALTPRSPSEQKRQDSPIGDPISEVLANIGLEDIVPHTRRSEQHNQFIEEHIRSRFEERDEDVDIDAPILTPKAHKRHVEERGLVGGLLRPLTGILAALDIPTPQESGLKEIPGDDPDHQYSPPGPTDIRGDCPTLNALANHGYLSRNGITTFAQAANAIQIAYSMSYDIAVFLSALGLLAGGDIPTGVYTIGGGDPRVPETLGVPVLGIDRHGLFEIDASVNRGDRYYGDNHSFNITRWNYLVDLANTEGDGLFNTDVMKIDAAQSVEWSRANNPEFAMGANFGVIYATRALLTRPLPNGTEPDFPNFGNIAPFYLNETFPEDWFRIPNSYSLVDLAGDIGDFFLFKPQPLGANVNGHFVPLDIQIPDAPLDVGCLALTLLASGVPDEAEPVVQAAAALFDQVFAPVLSGVCDITKYQIPSNSSYLVPGEYTNEGSGSGITSQGEFDSQTEKPTGESAGDPLRRKRSSLGTKWTG